MPLAVSTGMPAPESAGRDISVLPVEMLARCFAFLPAHIVSRLPILHVSRRWRYIALTSPDVWSQIELSGRTPKGHLLFDFVLSQTKSFPFDFSYSRPCSMELIADIYTVLQKHMHRMRSVHWSSTASPDLPLSGPAPLLEHISGHTLYPIPSDLLGGAPGRLRSLDIPALCLPEFCPALSTLKHLSSAVRSDINDAQFLGRLFALCPRLEMLRLTLDVKDSTLLPHGPAPASLTSLHLTVCSSASTLDLVALCSTWKTIPRIPRLKLESLTFNDSDLALAVDGAVELAIDHNAAATRQMRLSGLFADGREYTLHSWRKEPQAHRVAHALLRSQTQGRLNDLCRLAIKSDIFHIFAADARPLTHLAKLTIIVYPDAMARPPTIPWAHLSRLQAAPLLETLIVDIQYRGASGYGKYVATAADLRELAAVLRESVEKLQRRVSVVVKSVTDPAAHDAHWGDLAVTWLPAKPPVPRPAPRRRRP